MSTEQELADAFSRNVDALLSGAPLPENAPLLKIADLLASDSVQPGAAATARFEQQLAEWFPLHPPVRPFWRGILPIIILVMTLVVLIVIFGLMFMPVPQTTPGTATQPATSATTTFVRIVVSGSLEDIQGTTLTILGKTIIIEGTLPRLCIGDAIRIEAVLGSDGTLHADAKTITVQTSTCSVQPAQSSGGMGDMGDDN